MNEQENLPVTLPEGQPGRGEGADADVTSCRPLVALELGFQTRFLRTLQKSVWATCPTDIHNVDAGLESVYRRLLALSDRLGPLPFSWFLELKTHIEDRHDAAAVFAGQVRDELFDDADDPDEAMQMYARRIEERAVVLRAWQQQDWEEARLISWKAVEGDRRLEAWWEIGLRMADLILRVSTPQAPAIWTEADVMGLLGAVAKLPGEEKAWVEDILPSTPPTEPRFPFLLNEAYQDLRGFIPEFERRRAPAGEEGSGAAEEFVPSDSYRVCRWQGHEYKFNESQAAMIEALHQDTQQGGVGLSAAKLFKAAGLKRDDKRLEHVFRNKKEGSWVPHPAWVDGLIQHVHGGTYRLNIQEPKEPKS